MSAVDRLLTILLWAIAVGLSEAASSNKSKKKKKFPIGGIIGIVIVVVVIVIIICLILFLIKRKKSKKAGKIESQPPVGTPAGGPEGYNLGQGQKYDPVPAQQYQQQTNYGQPPQQPYGNGPPVQQQGYAQGPAYPGGPAPHGAAGDYYKP